MPWYGSLWRHALVDDIKNEPFANTHHPLRFHLRLQIYLLIYWTLTTTLFYILSSFIMISLLSKKGYIQVSLASALFYVFHISQTSTQRCFYHFYKHMSDLHEGYLCSSEGPYLQRCLIQLCDPFADLSFSLGFYFICFFLNFIYASHQVAKYYQSFYVTHFHKQISLSLLVLPFSSP